MDACRGWPFALLMAFRNQTLLSSSHLLGSDISGVVARQSQYFEYQGVIHNPGLPCTASLCIETRIARCTNPKCPGPQPQTLKSPHSSIAKLPHIELSKPGVAEAAGSKVPAARGQHDPCAASGSPGWGLGGKHPFEQQDSDHAQAPKSRRRPGIMCAPSPEQVGYPDHLTKTRYIPWLRSLNSLSILGPFALRESLAQNRSSKAGARVVCP